MITATFIQLFRRDLVKLISEIVAYKDEANIWVKGNDIANSAGNLALHIAGNFKHYIGFGLAQNNYVRNRPFEFEAAYIPREILIKELNEALLSVLKGLKTLNEEDLLNDYPCPIADKPKQTAFTLCHMLTHLNYHLGQINYHRKIYDK